LGLSSFKDKLRADNPTNLLVIVVDTLRADHLGCYGYANISTPHIDDLAKKGVLFKNVISHTPMTLPSHCSIFTGTYPQYHKVVDNGGYRLSDSAVTLAEIMKDAGYTTAAFVSTMVLDSRFGLKQGFDTYMDKMEKPKTKRVINFMDEERTADKVTQDAVKWLSENKHKKFFLWVHYYDPHNIYNPPSPYRELYSHNLYDGEIAFTDEQIGILLSSLKEFNLDKNTLIVFLSDHGEGLGEHDEPGHSIFVYDTTIKVPLIFVYPAVIPAGRVIEEQARLVDVMPTILDLLKLKKNKEIQGISLAAVILGKQKAINLPAYSQALYGQIHYNWSPLKSWREGDWKYINSAEPELFNLKDDPHELKNLAQTESRRIQEMEKKMEDFLKKTSSAKEKSAKIQLDEETKRKLESLGYVQGTLTPSANPVPRKMIKLSEQINTGDKLANAGRFAEAIAEYQKVLAEDPNNIEAYIHLGHVYKELKRYAEAIKCFRKAASFKADVAETHDGLGNVFKDMGQVQEAFKEFEIANALDPENPAIMNNLGWCYQQRYEFDKAIELYKKALAKDDTLATTHTNLAICYRVKGMLNLAYEEAKKALELEPDLGFAHSEMCAIIATLGDLQKAITYCQKAVELAPQAVDGYNNLGVCLEMKGDLEQALANYLKAAELNPWNPQLYSNIANVYLAKKDYAKAKEYAEKALEISPNFPKAKAILEAVKNK